MLDEGAAAVLTGEAALAGKAVTPETARSRVLPLDRARHERRFRLIARLGGPFTAEYRAVSVAGEVRNILERGRLFQDEHRKPTHALGIVIDATEPAIHRATLAAAAAGAGAEIVDEAVSHAIACRELIDRLGNSEMRLLVDMLLMRLGQELAKTS